MQDIFTRTYVCEKCGRKRGHSDMNVNRPSFVETDLDCADCGAVTRHKRTANGFPGMQFGGDHTVSGNSGIHSLDYKTNDVVKERALAIAAERNKGRDPRQFFGKSDD